MSESVQQLEQLDSYQESFRELERDLPGTNHKWLRKLREDAFARFSETGFPTTRMEDWRFTNVSAIAQTRFQLSRNGHDRLLPPSEKFALVGSCCELVFVNGRFAPELSSLSGLLKGLHIGSLAEELKRNPGAVEAHLGRYLDTQRDAFCALNTAFVEDGAYVHVAKGVAVEKAIHLLYLAADEGRPSMTFPRNLIVAGESSQVVVVEEYVSLGCEQAFCNSATEVVAASGAVVSHYWIEREHASTFNVSTLRIEQARNANVASHSVLVGGALVRNNVHPVMSGEGGECLINGLFIGNGRQHLDNYMLVEHASPHCSSRQFYNGILDDQAHGVFHGRIVVRKDAQKTDAKQTNRNLLLSDDAQIDTKPQLEIFADDVKCTHGATIGQIDENALFYLRSRGIDERAARQLLLVAFAGECLERMKTDAVRVHIEKLIGHHLRQLNADQKTTAKAVGGEGERNWEELQ
jgi:Fe-S cluster assembly protein SufD